MVRAGWPYLMIVASLVKKGVEDRRWRGSAREERKNKLKNCTQCVGVATAPRAWVDLLVLSALFLGICSLYFVLVKFAGCTFFFFNSLLESSKKDKHIGSFNPDSLCRVAKMGRQVKDWGNLAEDLLACKQEGA